MIDYKKEIAAYGNSIKSETEKNIARMAIQKLYNRGFGYDYIYYMIKHLNGKKIADYYNMLFYPNFQKEVIAIMEYEKEKEKEKENIPFWKKDEELYLFLLYGMDSYSNEEFEELRQLIDKPYEEYTEEDKQKINILFDKYITWY